MAGLPQHSCRQLPLNAAHVGSLFERLGDRRAGAGNPDLELGIKIERPSRFNREAGDGLIWDGRVSTLLPVMPWMSTRMIWD